MLEDNRSWVMRCLKGDKEVWACKRSCVLEMSFLMEHPSVQFPPGWADATIGSEFLLVQIGLKAIMHIMSITFSTSQ